MKSAKNLTVDRNGFTKPRFSEQESRCTEAFENTRFETKSCGIGKTVGATCGQDITPAILNGFDDNRNFYDTAKRIRRKDSVSNLSAKLQRESIRYKEVVELADALGYDLIWQKRRER